MIAASTATGRGNAAEWVILVRGSVCVAATFRSPSTRAARRRCVCTAMAA